MSWNRLGIDQCSYAQKLTQNVSQLGYVLDPMKYENCNKCRAELGWVGGNNVSKVKGNLVDLESNLFGIDREGSRCAAMKLLPGEVRGKSLYKETSYKDIDISKDHLNHCQPVTYPAVANSPLLSINKCKK